jgi:uncharacterized membrane protein SpoIIM required for sporulation
MILDLEKFTASAQPHWEALEAMLKKFDADSTHEFADLAEAQRFYYLYQRAASDLARLTTFSAEGELHQRLDALVGRAYAELHSARESGDSRWRPIEWCVRTFPRTFRRHIGAFWLSLLITIAGCALGGFAVARDPEAKATLLPFGHGEMDPNKRVADEERRGGKQLAGNKASFSAALMANNIRVSVTALALGLTWGIGTFVALFYNGVVLGGICVDYLSAGEGTFLAAWLLPHGSIEIPAILLAGQGGLMLARAVIGWGQRVSFARRLRAILPDLATLVGGIAVMLVWAGIIEAFLSQYHAPVLPYSAKIIFGSVQLGLLVAFLTFAGRSKDAAAPNSTP